VNRSIFTTKQESQLKKMGVVCVYLFGSRALGNQSEMSDYDYAVLMQKSGYKKGGAVYKKLLSLLSTISPRTLENDVIDLVFLRDVGLELKFHVVRYGRVLFETDSNSRQNFESETTLLYCDYRPLLDQFDEAILNSL
jgi:predicted nucleotidyltransferase